MPKDSTAALLLEGKEHLMRLLQEIPLGEAEQAAVDEGVVAYEKLLLKLADVPTPAGPTRRLGGRSAVGLYKLHLSDHSLTLRSKTGITTLN